MARSNLFGLDAFFRHSRASNFSRRDAMNQSGARKTRGRRLRVESLEQRQLLSTNMGFSKDDGFTEARPGDILMYDFDVVITSMTATATNVQITETVPTGCTFSEINSTEIWVQQGSTNVYVQTIGNVDPESEFPVTPIPFSWRLMTRRRLRKSSTRRSSPALRVTISRPSIRTP